MSTSTTQHDRRAPVRTEHWLTVPNALCVARLLGSATLVPLAVYERPIAFLITYLVLTSTDWIDGKIARWWSQESKIGPTLDTLADITMYAALLFGTLWLFGETLLAEGLLIGSALVLYAASCLASLLKFRRWPTYHTRSAKISWGLTLLAVMALFSGWSVIPLRIAAIGVALANLEAVLITLVLSAQASDVPSLYHALRRR